MLETSGKKPKLQMKVNVGFVVYKIFLVFKSAVCLLEQYCRCNNSECVHYMLILSLQLIELLPNG